MTRTAVGTESNWFDDDEIRELRRKLPILYVDIVPVRLDAYGAIREIGLLLRADGSGRIIRSLVSGRVLVHESLRETIIRHVEKDLGAVALPKVPTSMVPFTVAEYFPTPGQSPFVDPRQHAVSLAYIVPVEGDCAPQEDALDLGWFEAATVLDSAVMDELEQSHAILVRRALAAGGIS
ncbi:NUDIX hydrolase family protein [Dermabacter sp. p3-SID358]|uniref:NUDIX hydrolase family protein n=1 Tax=Dermabacter sp. p3-SID358 TaxID=2916114 RepID=UPI0021A2A619|nr:NUDIX hydrolase family protein [Dermabacter sp. p3-SID358]MCT1866774.1 NUDIX hydrolase family protein [Dermabacter sp. p3-SID358]